MFPPVQAGFLQPEKDDKEMKTIKNLFATLAILMIATFATTASAQCSGDTCVETMPELTNVLTVDLVTLGGLAGIGEVSGLGDEFVGRVDKISELTSDAELEVDWDGCPGDCGDIDLKYEGKALESILTQGIAVGSTPGEAVQVGNASQLLTQLGLQITIGGSDAPSDDGGN